MSLPRFPTYTYSISEVGPSGGGPSGSNKAMSTLFNPSSGTKLLKLVRLTVQPISTSGTNVIVEYNLRRITAHGGGTSLTPLKREQTDPTSTAEARQAPTSITGGAATDTVFIHIFQSNAVQAPNAYSWRFGDNPEEKPWVLAPGEGFVFHQVTSNGGNFAISPVWIEV